MTISREQMNREADYFEREAVRADVGAADGRRVAADTTECDYSRACAARAAEIATENAAEYRHIASVLRDGEIPEGLDLT